MQTSITMKKAVLLIHGFATNSEDFDPIIPELAKIYDHIEAKNLPGHDTIHLKGFKEKDTIDFVEHQISNLEKEYDVIDILGFSMGGALAAMLASHHKVEHLILLAPAILYLNANYPISRFKKYLHYLDAKLALDIKKDSSKQYEIDDYHMRLLEDKDALEIFKRFIMPNYSLRTINEFAKIVKYCRNHLAPIEAKTLVIMGDIDQLVPKSVDKYLDDYCKDKITITIKNASHMMLRSKKSQEIIEQIVTFLSN